MQPFVAGLHDSHARHASRASGSDLRAFGAGKTTLLKRLYSTCPLPLVASVSATTGRPRPGEVDGVDYHFLSREEFARRREAGEFLECCEVYGRGDWYGTLKSEVTPSLEAGKWVVLEIDVQGTLAVLEHYPDALTIFIQPASIDELERRLESAARKPKRPWPGGWKWLDGRWTRSTATVIGS